MVMPLRLPGHIGFQLMQRLNDKYEKLSHLPQIIHLNSARVLTLEDIALAWNTLSPEGGIIYGSNWATGSKNVALFASCITGSPEISKYSEAMSRALNAPRLRGHFSCYYYSKMRDFFAWPESKVAATARFCSSNEGGGHEVRTS